MRYRLRTLLILLTLGPLILALGWWEYGKYSERQRLREAQQVYEAMFKGFTFRGVKPQYPSGLRPVPGESAYQAPEVK